MTVATTSASRLGLSTYEDNKGATGKTSTEMGKQDFLTLFTAQLKNQNPLDPVKNEAFVAQLAQFSQLEALTNMEGSLDRFVTSMSGERMLGGAALIGKRVPITDGTGRLEAGGQVPASINLPDGASGITVQIRDAKGNIVQELTSGAQNPGPVDFSWNGQDSSGKAMAAGTYFFSATAVVNSKTQTVPVETQAVVRSITSNPTTGDVSLHVDGGKSVLLSQVKRIGQ